MEDSSIQKPKKTGDECISKGRELTSDKDYSLKREREDNSTRNDCTGDNNSNDSSSRAIRKRKKHADYDNKHRKKHRKSRHRHEHKKKHKKHKSDGSSKKKRRKHSSSSSSGSTHDDDSSTGSDSNVRRSAISGKKIQMHIEKTNEDLVQEKVGRFYNQPALDVSHLIRYFILLMLHFYIISH